MSAVGMEHVERPVLLPAFNGQLARSLVIQNMATCSKGKVVNRVTLLSSIS